MRALSLHTGVEAETVKQTSLREYEGLLYQHYRWSGSQYWLLPLKMVDTTFRHHGLQFCPQCLAEDAEPYFRKRWRVAFYTMCTKHQCMVHDRCPSCGAPVAFHRREMGKFSKVEAGAITVCHACEFDLRAAASVRPIIYDESAFRVFLSVLQMIESGEKTGGKYDVGFFSVLHQLCKIMLMHNSNVRLRQYVSGLIEVPKICLQKKHNPFERYSLADRYVVMQLVMWLLADPMTRITQAWCNKAVRYCVLKKDLKSKPLWYVEIVDQCSDWRNSDAYFGRS